MFRLQYQKLHTKDTSAVEVPHCCITLGWEGQWNSKKINLCEYINRILNQIPLIGVCAVCQKFCLLCAHRILRNWHTDSERTDAGIWECMFVLLCPPSAISLCEEACTLPMHKNSKLEDSGQMLWPHFVFFGADSPLKMCTDANYVRRKVLRADCFRITDDVGLMLLRHCEIFVRCPILSGNITIEIRYGSFWRSWKFNITCIDPSGSGSQYKQHNWQGPK